MSMSIRIYFYFNKCQNAIMTNMSIKKFYYTTKVRFSIMSKNKQSEKRQYRINLDEETALRLDIVCAVKNKTPSDYINSLLDEEFKKLDAKKLDATIDNIKSI